MKTKNNLRLLRTAMAGILLLLCLPLSLHANKNEKAARALAERLFPTQASQFVFEQIESENGQDVFEIESSEGKIHIRGNSANSMAVGLNHYLKYYCHTTISWYADDPVEMPKVLPDLPKKIRIAARMKNRFFLNYCTFGYTMPWWQWNDWERFIDWMALNGINQPLAITGQEAIWLRVWKKLGLNEQDIREYFTGPAHLPWHRMTNIDHFQGPLPYSFMEHQEKLQKRIVDRERKLNMTPILPAFAGHVPQALTKVYPNAKINRMSSWGGFRDTFRSYFLDPLDPLFPVIQKAYLKEQTRLYGTDHIYGADPFNEIESPSWEPDYLATVARTIYHTITQVDPEAVWLQMTWLFYFDRGHWTGPRIDAFVNGVPRNKMLLLDYYAENTEIWKRTNSYYGQPFLWCYLGNFGGNTMLNGNLKETGRRIENVYRNGGSNFAGIGSTLESFDVNPFIYEYVFEKAWQHNTSDERWMTALADRRYGKPDENVRKAWQLLYEKVYAQSSMLGRGTLTNARPTLKGSGTWTVNPSITYDNKELFRAWELLLAARNGSQRDAYVFDVVNVGRQVLGNYFQRQFNEFMQAYRQQDELAARRKGAEMEELLNDLDQLLSCHLTFSYGRWINDAAAFGTTPAEKEYYKHNARTLLTLWGERGQSLNDYANRSWADLTRTYYAPRWHAFINDVCNSLAEKRPFDEQAFREKVLDMEADWAANDHNGATTARTDGLQLAFRLMEKYRQRILE